MWGLLISVGQVRTISGEAAQGAGGLMRGHGGDEAVARVLLGDGFRVCVEVGAQPVVANGVQETIEDAGVQGGVVGTLRRD
ncbi:hypothetical protein CLM83_27960 [Streptomyces albidoflavus]|nr:hypothetical protein CLM83_27960 [Streptomyces albidoflavus]